MRSGNANPARRDKVPVGRLPTKAPLSSGCDPRPADRKEDVGSRSPLDTANREIARLSSELEAERKKRATLERNLQDARREIESNNSCLEEAFGKANQMALKAEIMSIELNQIFNSSVDGMWVIDKDFKILRINDTLLNLLQRERAETVGEKCHAVFPGPNCHTPRCPLTCLSLGEQSPEADRQMDLADGTRRHLLASAAPFHGVDGGLFGIVEAFRDITERKQAEEAVRRANEELQRLATIDGLTQVANRRRFDEVLQIEWKRMSREQKPLSIILSDLDFFKLYNDTYGHLSGDDCLRAVARCVSDETKRPSDLAARYGGEEFVVLLPNTDSEGALQVAEGVLKRVAKMNIEHSKSAVAPHVTLSLGVATAMPGCKTSLSALIDTADRALYQAKKQGRNRVIFLAEP